MILIFGPAGSGKSLQGQILAARFNWAWLSMGQLLRETDDPKLNRIIAKGDLVPDKISNEIMNKAIKKAAKTHPQMIIDGYARNKHQAQMIYENNWQADLAIVLTVPHREVLKRMMCRARADDNKDTIKERLAVFNKNNAAIVKVLNDNGTKVVEVNGVGTVGQVHDRIMKVLAKCKLV
jgi:adenylate kinase